MAHEFDGHKYTKVSAPKREWGAKLIGWLDQPSLVLFLAWTRKEFDKYDTTRYVYDALNRLTKVINSIDHETVYGYDDRNNLTSLTDANGNTTRFEYDKNNRLVKEISPMGQQTTYAYDPAGNPAEKIDPKNQKIEYEYDDANRLFQTRYHESANDQNPVKSHSQYSTTLFRWHD